MTTVRELISEFGLDFDDRGSEKADRSMDGLIGKLRQLGGLLAGGFVARAVTGFATNMAAAGDSVDKTALRTGFATGALQELRYAGELNGVAIGEMDASLDRFNRRLGAAVQGTGPAKDALKRLRIELNDGAGQMRSNADIMDDVADRIAATEDPAQRAKIAFDLFGRAGTGMVTMLSQGSEGLQRMRQEARETGGVMGDDLVAKSVELTDNLLRWRMTMQGVRNMLGNALLPRVNDFVQSLSGVVRHLQQVFKGTKVVEIALTVLGAAAMAAGLKMLIPFLPFLAKAALIAAAVGLIIAVVDEMHALFEGGRSIVAEWIDSLLGVGTAEAIVDTLVGLWEQLIDDIGEATDFVIKWGGETVKWVGKAFGAVSEFGTKALDWVENIFGARFIEILKDVGKRAIGLLFPTSDIAPTFKAWRDRGKKTRQRRQREREAERASDQPGQPQPSRAARPAPQLTAGSTPEQSVAAATAPTASAVAPRGGGTVNQRNRIDLSVNGSGNTREVGDEVERRLEGLLSRQMDDAFEALDRDLD